MQITIEGVLGGKFSYSQKDSIGYGSYATVYKAINQKSKETVAIKVLGDVREGMRKKNTKYYEIGQREVNIYKQLPVHENLAKLIDYAEDEEYVYIVIEFCEGGVLREKLKSSKFGEPKSLKILTEIAKGLQALHKSGIMHRDLNLQNILLKNGHYKIADFGSSLKEKTSNKEAGTHTYKAPEIIRIYRGEQVEYTNKVDVWALGVMFYKMLFGKKEFKERLENIEEGKKGKEKYPQERNISNETMILLDRMLRVDPQRRMTMDEVVNFLERMEAGQIKEAFDEEEEEIEEKKESKQKIKKDKEEKKEEIDGEEEEEEDENSEKLNGEKKKKKKKKKKKGKNNAESNEIKIDAGALNSTSKTFNKFSLLA